MPIEIQYDIMNARDDPQKLSNVGEAQKRLRDERMLLPPKAQDKIVEDVRWNVVRINSWTESRHYTCTVTVEYNA